MDTSTLEAVGEHPLIGALINDRYVVDSVIGKGSSGIVYKATRLLMGREVAVKVLHSYLGAEVGALDRFLREARQPAGFDIRISSTSGNPGLPTTPSHTSLWTIWKA